MWNMKGTHILYRIFLKAFTPLPQNSSLSSCISAAEGISRILATDLINYILTPGADHSWMVINSMYYFTK